MKHANVLELKTQNKCNDIDILGQFSHNLGRICPCLIGL